MGKNAKIYHQTSAADVATVSIRNHVFKMKPISWKCDEIEKNVCYITANEIIL